MTHPSMPSLCQLADKVLLKAEVPGRRKPGVAAGWRGKGREGYFTPSLSAYAWLVDKVLLKAEGTSLCWLADWEEKGREGLV